MKKKEFKWLKQIGMILSLLKLLVIIKKIKDLYDEE